jgi:hypothetical protein
MMNTDDNATPRAPLTEAQVAKAAARARALIELNTVAYVDEDTLRMADDALAMATELAAFKAAERELADERRKRGTYWLTPEGRAELRDTFSDPEDDNAVRPLLDALERVIAEVRDESERMIHDHGCAALIEDVTNGPCDCVSGRLRAIVDRGGREG